MNWHIFHYISVGSPGYARAQSERAVSNITDGAGRNLSDTENSKATVKRSDDEDDEETRYEKM